MTDAVPVCAVHSDCNEQDACWDLCHPKSVAESFRGVLPNRRCRACGSVFPNHECAAP